MMDEQQWQRVEQALSGIRGMVVMRINDHTVTFSRQLIDKDRLGIVSYVDGEFLGCWMSGSRTYPQQQYLRRVVRPGYTGKMRAAAKRLKASTRKAMGIDLDRKVVSYSPFWSSFTTLRRHYQKNFSTAELVEVVG